MRANGALLKDGGLMMREKEEEEEEAEEGRSRKMEGAGLTLTTF